MLSNGKEAQLRCFWLIILIFTSVLLIIKYKSNNVFLIEQVIKVNDFDFNIFSTEKDK